MAAGTWGGWSHWVHRQDTEEDECWCSACTPLFLQYSAPKDVMVSQLRWASTPQLTSPRDSLTETARGLTPGDSRVCHIDDTDNPQITAYSIFSVEFSLKGTLGAPSSGNRFYKMNLLCLAHIHMVLKRQNCETWGLKTVRMLECAPWSSIPNPVSPCFEHGASEWRQAGFCKSKGVLALEISTS